MTPETTTAILFLSPLAVGGIIAVLNANSVNNATEKFEAWTKRNQALVSKRDGWFSSYIVNPILWVVVKFSDWTDNFRHRGLKSGARVSATLYLIAMWCFILYAAFMIALVFIIGAAAIYIAFKIAVGSNEDVKKGYNTGRRVVGYAGKGKRVNSETGVIQEDGLLGWSDTNQRIDPNSGKVQEDGLLGWNDTGTRVNQETGNIQKDGLFGYSDSETRINPETGIIQKDGLLGWSDTDQRIDPKTGKHQTNRLLGWTDD